MRVLVFGDSITYGKWDSRGGWCERLREHYDKQAIEETSREFPNVYNLGISGDTTPELLQRFEHETKARVSSSDEFTFVITIGTNDSLTEGPDKPRSTPQKYEQSLDGIIQAAKKYSPRIMFVGLQPCIEAVTTPVSWRNVYYTNERLQSFEKAMRQVCLKNNILHIAIFEAFENKLRAGERLFHPDGLHPSDEGHELIFQLVQPVLDKLLAG